jgi:hypothetical protein
MAGLDKLTAGLLSEAAYIPKDTFAAPGGAPAGAVPDGWRADTALSVRVENNQFIVFVNDATRQAVITFKGTDSLSQLKSDLVDDAASQWTTLKDALADNFADIRTKYAGYELMTDGTSSGEVIGGDLLMKRAHKLFINGAYPDRNHRAKARRTVRGGGWRHAQRTNASMTCIRKRFA